MIFNPAYDQLLFDATSRICTCTIILHGNYISFGMGKWRSYNLFPVVSNYDVKTRATNFCLRYYHHAN